MAKLKGVQSTSHRLKDFVTRIFISLAEKENEKVCNKNESKERENTAEKRKELERVDYTMKKIWQKNSGTDKNGREGQRNMTKE